MTQEEKQLLLKDLCARLPYGVKVCAKFNTGNSYTAEITAISMDRDYVQIRKNNLHPYTSSSIEDIRLFLRPMSSMTDEERDEWFNVSYQAALEALKKKQLDNTPNALANVVSLDWLSVHHFDYNSLIEKGLALIAPEGMYKTE